MEFTKAQVRQRLIEVQAAMYQLQQEEMGLSNMMNAILSAEREMAARANNQQNQPQQPLTVKTVSNVNETDGHHNAEKNNDDAPVQAIEEEKVEQAEERADEPTQG